MVRSMRALLAASAIVILATLSPVATAGPDELRQALVRCSENPGEPIECASGIARGMCANESDNNCYICVSFEVRDFEPGKLPIEAPSPLEGEFGIFLYGFGRDTETGTPGYGYYTIQRGPSEGNKCETLPF